MTVPEAFESQMRALLPEEYEAFVSAMDRPAVASLRLNRRKSEGISLPAAEISRVPWCPAGVCLETRPSYTADPLFHAGCYYVQETSSMFLWTAVAQALRTMDVQGKALRVLDLCAAPGGKSTLLLDALPEGSLLVANEVVPQRAHILAENLIKWGNAHIMVTQADPSAFGRLFQSGRKNWEKAFPDGGFDLILTDVPCSGEGMFRKEPEAVRQWTPGLVADTAALQREILRSVWPALRPGGCLIYSTCTFNLRENEENVLWMVRELDARPVPIDTQDILGKSREELALSGSLDYAEGKDLPVNRFLFHRTSGEGLFMTLLRKESSSTASAAEKRLSADASADRQKAADRELLLKCGLKRPEQFLHTEFAGRHWALPLMLGPVFEAFDKAHIRLLHTGICLGELKGKDLVPDVSLALSCELDTDRVATCALDRPQALAYLRREALVLPPETPRGFVLLCYEGWPLGWVKNLGNRANNMYPNEWRIRSQIV